MLAGPLPPRVGHVIAEREPILSIVLNALATPDEAYESAADFIVEVGLLNGRGVQGARAPPIVLEAGGRFVQHVSPSVAVLGDPGVDVVSDVVRRLVAEDATEVSYVGLVPQVHTQFQRLR